MSVFEALQLMIAFAALIVSILILVVAIIALKDNKK
ncbi:putative holin-like toxin [Gemella cuniculi]|nr:putative holin-like toxin [Gemella cuniculi]